MFNRLHYYNPDHEIERFSQLRENQQILEKNWGLETRKVEFFDLLFSKTPEKGSSFTIENSGLNQDCGAFYYLQSLNRLAELSQTQQKASERLKGLAPKCVPAEFPKYELALNTWINIIMLFLTTIMSILGWLYYSSTSISSILNEK